MTGLEQDIDSYLLFLHVSVVPGPDLVLHFEPLLGAGLAPHHEDEESQEESRGTVHCRRRKFISQLSSVDYQHQ